MKIEQSYKSKSADTWTFIKKCDQPLNNALVLAFGSRIEIEKPGIYEKIKTLYPDSNIVLGSTAGEILKDELLSDSITLTAIEFDKSIYEISRANIEEFNNDSYKTAENLAAQLRKEGLRHVFVLSEGSLVNGSALIKGLTQNGINSPISGGLCGDGESFGKTVVGVNAAPKTGEIAIIALYGDDLEISCSQYCGWDTFGPIRTITKSEGNLLYEIDHKPALNLYKKYLGAQSLELPKSAILYPLYVLPPDKTIPYVRTVLSVDEKNNTMTLAGDVPQGSTVQLMMTSADHIIDGANQAAVISMQGRKKDPEVAILISCVGRKMLMDQRTEEELEEVYEILGNDVSICGFYSYGEIAPLGKNIESELHNQTMTITLISE